MKDEGCAYCEEGALVEKFGIKIAELVVGDGTFDVRKALLAMQREIKADGKVDFQVATILLKAMNHLAGSGATTDAFIKALREVRADGVITAEESARILKLLDELLV